MKPPPPMPLANELLRRQRGASISEHAHVTPMQSAAAIAASVAVPLSASTSTPICEHSPTSVATAPCRPRAGYDGFRRPGLGPGSSHQSSMPPVRRQGWARRSRGRTLLALRARVRCDEADDDRKQHSAGADERDADPLALALDIWRSGAIRVLAISEQRCALGIGAADRLNGRSRHECRREQSDCMKRTADDPRQRWAGTSRRGHLY